MLLINETTRKYSAVLSTLWLLFVTLLPTFEALAITPPTDAEKAAVANLANQSGYANVNGTPLSFKKINSNDTINVTPNSLQSLVNTTTAQQQQITGLGTQAAPTDITNHYRGTGRNGLESITTVNQAGQQVPTCNSNEVCPATDKACIKRVTACKASVAGVTSAATDKEPQRAQARQMRTTMSTMDPINVIGLNNPPEAHSSICTTSSISLPQQTTTTQCLHGNFYKITGVRDSNVTTLQEASPAICESGYTLNTSNHLCEKVVIACPEGYTNQSGTCVRPAYCYDASASMNNISAAACPSGYYSIGNNQCRQDIYSCNSGDIGGGINNSTCQHNDPYASTATTTLTCPSSYPFYVGIGTSMTCASGYPASNGPGQCTNGGSAMTTGFGASCVRASTTGTAVYSCPSGGTLSGTSCVSSYDATATTTCNGSVYCGICIAQATASYPTVPNAGGCNTSCLGSYWCYIPGTWTTTYSCPSGGTLSGTSCVSSYDASISGYTCPSGYYKDETKTPNMCYSGYLQSTGPNQCTDGGSFTSYYTTWVDPNSGASAGTLAYGCQTGSTSPNSNTQYSCPTGGTLSAINPSQCDVFSYYQGALVSSTIVNNVCGTGQREVSSWSTSSIQGDLIQASTIANGINNYSATWGNISSSVPKDHLQNTYTWTWNFSLTNVSGVTGTLDQIFTPPDSIVTIKLNGQTIGTGDFTSILREGSNSLVMTMKANATTYAPGLKLRATANIGGVEPTAQCYTQGTYCSAGGTVSGSNCCLPYATAPLTSVTLQQPFTCAATQTTTAFYRCNNATDYLDTNTNTCVALADKTTVASTTIGVQYSRVTIDTTYDFRGSSDGTQWISDFYTPRDPLKGDGSYLTLNFLNNQHVQISGRMWSQNNFDTTTNNSNRIEFHNAGVPQGYLEFTMSGGLPVVSGSVTTPRFTISTNNTSCITLNPGNNQFCFGGSTATNQCPVGFTETPGLPKACATTPYSAIPYCADTFQLTTGSNGDHQCVKAPTPSPTTNNCITTYQTCPDGTFLNGGRCTGNNVMNMGEDCEILPAPSGSPSGSTPTETVYLCKVGVVDECATVDAASCTLRTDTCIDTIMAPGSSRNGQCAMHESTYQCTTAGLNLSSTQCSFQPMCYNGTCFTPPGTQCQGTTTTTNRTETESCAVVTDVEFRQCSLVETRDSQQKVIGFTAGSDCSNINTQGEAATCTQIPPTFNPTAANGVYAPGRYPAKLTYSCLKAPRDDCANISSAPGRTLTSSSCLEYQCLDPLPLTSSTVQQTGILGSYVSGTTTGAAPSATTDFNSCSNRGACVYQEKVYSHQVSHSTPSDECTTDLSQVLVSMETARQAGAYVDPANVRIFSGEFSRCDRRRVSVSGLDIGSKSCCNIRSPDAKSNNDILGGALMSNAGQNGLALLDSGFTKASGYMFDYMLNSSRFSEAALSAWSKGIFSDTASVAASGGTVGAFTPSINVMGVTASVGGVSTGMYGSFAQSFIGKSLGLPATSILSPISMGSLATPFGTMNFSIDPVSLGFQAGVALYQAYQAALACDEEDYKSSTKTNAKLCYNTGSWCQTRDCGLFGCTCTKYRTGKCCFNSKLARIINEQGRSQLGLNMRECNGFTSAQIQQLDWSRIDLTEFIAEMLAKAQESSAGVMNEATQSLLQNKLRNNATSNAQNGTQPTVPHSR